MISLTVKINNLDQLRSNFQKAPALTLKYLARATAASIFEVEKQATDSNAQFKTPRALRTGALLQSFSLGRSISADGLRASIGPTARHRGFYYPAAVYFGTKRGKPNLYMDRMAKAAEPAVGRHFEKAVDSIVDKLASV